MSDQPAQDAQSHDDDVRLLTPREAGRILGVTDQGVLDIMRRGELALAATRQVGKQTRYLFHPVAVETLARRRRAQQQSDDALAEQRETGH